MQAFYTCFLKFYLALNSYKKEMNEIPFRCISCNSTDGRGFFIWKICSRIIWIHKIYTAICKSGQAGRFT